MQIVGRLTSVPDLDYEWSSFGLKVKEGDVAVCEQMQIDLSFTFLRCHLWFFLSFSMSEMMRPGLC